MKQLNNIKRKDLKYKTYFVRFSIFVTIESKTIK